MYSSSPRYLQAKPLTAKHQMSVHILHTVLCRYPKLLTKRIYLILEMEAL